MKPVILASSSPRRRMLLDQVGLPYRVVTSFTDESLPEGLSPSGHVEILARRKAQSVADKINEGLVIGADTIVVWREQILGKPLNNADAVSMLRKLQGSVHEVFTGLAVIDVGNKDTVVTHERTEVKFRPVSDEEILRYVSTGEPLDKAGAYAAQGVGAIFISEIHGCYFNVVGLPLARLALVLDQFGISIF